MTHWGATLGLAAGLIGTAYKGYQAWKEGWPVLDTMQGCWTGYSFEKEDFDVTRMVGTIPTVAGGVATKVAIWTGYNAWTPKNVNI